MITRARMGVIGVGNVGQHHARIFSQMSSCELAGIYDSSPERALEVARLFKTRAFTSLDELMGLIDAASVVLPPAEHAGVFSKLAARRIHVLMDGPLAMSAAEAEKMVTDAAANGLILQACRLEKFNPDISLLAGRISNPVFADITHTTPYPPPRAGAQPEGTEVSVVLDLMLRDLEVLLRMMDCEVVEASAVGMPILSTSEDIANARLVFRNGCVANVTASRISQERLRKFRVYRPDSYATLDFTNQTGQFARILGGRVCPEPVPANRADPLAAELASFATCVTTYASDKPQEQHAAQALQLAVRICGLIRGKQA